MAHAGGRPTVMTEKVLQKLEEAFAFGCSDLEACLYADIEARTLYYYQEKHPKFIQRKELLKQNPVLRARNTVVKALTDDPDLAMKYLERKVKSEFSLRSELTGAEGKDLPTPIYNGESIKNDKPDKN